MSKSKWTGKHITTIYLDGNYSIDIGHSIDTIKKEHGIIIRKIFTNSGKGTGSSVRIAPLSKVKDVLMAIVDELEVCAID